jgi:catechol 2,3-dioxygenase
VTSQRPEIGAALSHLSIRSADPARLSSFFEDIYAMTRHPIPGGWKCEAPGRVLLIAAGTPNSVAFFAYQFDDRAALHRYRENLRGRALIVGRNLSPLFDDSAFSAADPDGNVVVFGVRAHFDDDVATDDLPARVQHVAFRTPNMEAMLSFYRDVLGFVLSDRVEDDQGTLRACFLRTDHEHHALALFGSSETRLDHVSCETRDIGTLTAWADRVSTRRVPLHWGVGRHGPGNDVFFMVKDPDDNLIEISAELERVDAARPAGVWPHEQRTLNLWGTAIMRS